MEVPWPLGPPDGRYLVRPLGDPDGSATHVVAFATLGAAERRRRRPGRDHRRVAPQPEPEPVATGRATVIDVSDELPDEDAAQAWLHKAGEAELATGLAVLDRALHAHRVAAADPDARPVGRAQLLVARVGFGAGEEVADGVWTSARELPPPRPERRSRRAAIAPQARLAAILGARQPALVCEELALRARSDLDLGRDRQAALQLAAALEAALAELASEPAASGLSERRAELAQLQAQAVRPASRAALAGELDPTQAQAVAHALSRLEAALRARAATLV
ncbi:MAG: hypothetical protein ACRDMJ_15105 [Solirubrobacteraceae bacterium]